VHATLLTDEILAKARDMNPAALGALLSSGYAAAHRISLALCGHEGVAQAVANLLARRALTMLPRWRDASSPENWFVHHAVLTTRDANVPLPAEPLLDPLVVHGGAAAHDPAYVAFVRAVRQLHPQQSEAFILHHGERLNTRMLGVAMDCSTAAARMHLQVADDHMKAVGGDRAFELRDALTRAYAAMGEAMPPAESFVRIEVRRVRWRRWLRRVTKTCVTLLVLGGLGYAAWFFRDELLAFARSLRESPTTQPTSQPTTQSGQTTPPETTRSTQPATTRSTSPRVGSAG
jgi:DNA-directed RNA polymerase specialized sigma24 family protein